MRPHLLIEGTPGAGKTTLIRETILPYEGRVGGFLTLEKLEDGRRQGFEMLCLPEKKRFLFAGKDIRGDARVGKYGVDLGVFEKEGLASLRQAQKNPELRLIVIDEIGVMEAASAQFRRIVLELMANALKPVLATIRSKNKPFSDEIKEFPNLRFLTLARENYPQVKKIVKKWIRKIMTDQ